MLILDLRGISFHAVVVFGLGKNLLFNSIIGCCVFCCVLLQQKLHVLVDVISNIMTQIKVKKCAWSDMVRSIHDPLEYLTVLLLAQIL